MEQERDGPQHARRKAMTVDASRCGGSALAREWPRYLLSAVAVAGLAASARFAIDPPRPVDTKATAPARRRRIWRPKATRRCSRAAT